MRAVFERVEHTGPLGGTRDGQVAERYVRERALRSAILLDAIRCLAGAPGTHRPGTQRAAFLWFRSRDVKAPFSFHNVCEALGLDPARIRAALLGGRGRSLGSIIRRERVRSRGSTLGLGAFGA